MNADQPADARSGSAAVVANERLLAEVRELDARRTAAIEHAERLLAAAERGLRHREA
jgi:hypothetical protein